MLNEYKDLVKLALQCLAAQWFGYGKSADYCGNCVKCAMIRYAVLAVFGFVVYAISSTLFFGIIFAWVAYSTLSGSGWAGTYLHDKACLLWSKFKRKD